MAFVAKFDNELNHYYARTFSDDSAANIAGSAAQYANQGFKVSGMLIQSDMTWIYGIAPIMSTFTTLNSGFVLRVGAKGEPDLGAQFAYNDASYYTIDTSGAASSVGGVDDKQYFCYTFAVLSSGSLAGADLAKVDYSGGSVARAYIDHSGIAGRGANSCSLIGIEDSSNIISKLIILVEFNNDETWTIVTADSNLSILGAVSTPKSYVFNK